VSPQVREETARVHAKQEAESKWRKDELGNVLVKIEATKDAHAKLKDAMALELQNQLAIKVRAFDHQLRCL
jgi:hypothetical protein